MVAFLLVRIPLVTTHQLFYKGIRRMKFVGGNKLAVALLFVIIVSADGAISNVGVNYGDLADNLPPPADIVKLLQSASIGRMKLYDADPGILAVLSNTGIEVVVGVTNEEITKLNSPSVARTWVAENVVRHMPGTKIRYISVGNEVLSSTDQQVVSLLLAAMQNLHNALISYKVDEQVKISTPHSLGILSASFPPSSGAFKSNIAESVLKPLLGFLSQTKAPLMINAYPYFAYRSNPGDISLPYALFLPNNGFTDPRTGLIYTNLLSAQLDAVNFAMEKLNFRNLPIVVSETGWPSIGDVGEAGVSVQNAMTYNKNLISFVGSGVGTPARPRQPIETYIFSLFNENLKPGQTSERNFGIFRPDGVVAYDIGLMKTAVSGSEAPSPPTSSNGSNNNPSTSNNAPMWCIARPNADANSLLAALNYACGEGGADCSAIQFGAPCFFPNDLVSHASYAFNSYFLKRGGNRWNCYFGNNAILTISDPSYGVCTYPSK